MVCIDAFSRAYISKEYTPFLSGLASRGVATSLSPLFAFRGIETTMFTGVWPEVHGI
ncbi:MAG: alkaline phosphatase family protein [Nitrososphaeraceae archaeon]